MTKASLFSDSPFFVALTCVCFLSCSGRDSSPVRGRPEAHREQVRLAVNWGKVVRVSDTHATLQAVVSPLMSRGSPIHNKIFNSLRDLHCDLVRYVPWLPYPKLAVAEIEPPSHGHTSWDFSLIDSFAEDFARATEGHSTIWNFSTIPEWMFETPKPVSYPANPDQVTWTYEQGRRLRDPSMKQVADYYERLASWYTKGGFRDEYGHEHTSGHHYKIAYWEVLNEVDFEHSMAPRFYTELYDSIVGAIRRVDPQIKFVGLALASTSADASMTGIAPGFFEYFLDHENHKRGIPLDMISYHFYASPTPDQSPDVQQYTFFDQADDFIDEVHYIQAIRQRLSPETETTADEIGAISADDFRQAEPGHVTQPIPPLYWNLCSALYAYLYGQLALEGVEGVGESALAQLPGFFPSVTMIDWNTGRPNARYWTLKLLNDNFAPGDKLISTTSSVPYVYGQGFLTPDGSRKVLLVNKRDRTFDITIPGAEGGTEQWVDQTTAFNPPGSAHMSQNTLELKGLGVAVVTLNR
jgi:hypothetical protein